MLSPALNAVSLENSARRAAPPVALFGTKEAPLQALRTGLTRVGWLSWWAQLILSTVTGVLLLFANSVSSQRTAAVLAGRALAVAGLASSIASTLWTLGYGRLANKLGRTPETTPAEAAKLALGVINKGVMLNLIGMGLSVLGAQAIVGVLAAKALAQSQVLSANPVQALDLLIVQANGNTVLSHFLSLALCLNLRGTAERCASAAPVTETAAS